MDNSSIHRSAKNTELFKRKKLIWIIFTSLCSRIGSNRAIIWHTKEANNIKKNKCSDTLEKRIGNKNVKRDCRIFRYDSHNENMGHFVSELKNIIE